MLFVGSLGFLFGPSGFFILIFLVAVCVSLWDFGVVLNY
jgi:hypothetical protein